MFPKKESLQIEFKDDSRDSFNFDDVIRADRAPKIGLVERFNFGLLPRFNLSLVARFNFGLPNII